MRVTLPPYHMPCQPWTADRIRISPMYGRKRPYPLYAYNVLCSPGLAFTNVSYEGTLRLRRVLGSCSGAEGLPFRFLRFLGRQ